jgi:hypothetical protein
MAHIELGLVALVGTAGSFLVRGLSTTSGDIPSNATRKTAVANSCC